MNIFKRRVWVLCATLPYTSDKIAAWFAWHLPKRIVYWAVIRAASETERYFYPGDVTAMEMLKNLYPLPNKEANNNA